MKVKVVANELVDTDIEMVSLVRHGANRCPFKVLKSEDDAPAKLGDKLQSFFTLAKSDVVVTAYFIRKDATAILLPVLKAEGVDVSAVTEADGVTVVKTSDLPSRGFIQLGDALAVAISHPLKEFSDESVVKAYAEGAGLTGFAPSINLAVNGLADTVWSLLNSSAGAGDSDERVMKVDAMLASFRKYITSLAKMLPEQIFKVEAAAKAAQTEETDMPKGKLDEAVAGDLDGLLKSEEPAAAPAPVVEPVVVKAEEPAPSAEPVDANAALVATLLKALEPISAKLDQLTKTVADQQTVTDSLAAQFVETRESLAKAEQTRRTTTVVGHGGDMDLALSTLGGGSQPSNRRSIQKSGEAVWDGLFSDLDTFRPSR